MKLHLPKLLQKALIGSVISAPALVGMLGSNALAYRFEAPYGGQVFAGPFELTFGLPQSVTTDTVLASYRTNGHTGDHAQCQFILKADGSLILARYNSAGTTMHDSSVFKNGDDDYELVAGKVYTIDFKGGDNGTVNANLMCGGEQVATFANGSFNMNGGSPFITTFNDAYKAFNTASWNVTNAEHATLGYAIENMWTLESNYSQDTESNNSLDTITSVKGGDIVFGAEENLVKDITIASTFFADSVSFLDNYTLTSTGSDVKLDTTSITIADGKTLTLSGAMTVAGTINGNIVSQNGTLSLGGIVNGNIDVQGGEVTINNSVNGLITIADGTVATNSLRNGASVMVVGGGTLKLTGHDGAGYDGNALSSLTLKGSEGKVATLDVDDTGSCTFTTTISMQGYSQVIGSAINTWRDSGTNIQVSNKENTISLSTFDVRKHATINVDQDGELLISCTVADGSDRAGLLTKTGAGKLVLSGTNTYTGGTSVNAGTLETKSDSALGTGKVVMNGGKLQQNGESLTVSAMDYKSGTVDNGGQNLTVEGTLNVESKMEIAGTGATSIGTLNLALGLSSDSAAVTTSGALTLGSITLNLTDYAAGNYTLVSATGDGSISWDAKAENAWSNTGLREGLEASVLLAADNKTLQLTISEMVTPSESLITATVVEKNDGGSFVYGLEGTTLTLTVKSDSPLDSLAVDGMVTVDLISEGMMNAILADLTNSETGEVTKLVTLKLTDGTTTIAADAFNKVVFVKGETGQNYWGEMVGSQLMYNVERIPEPASATLSLAALMMLCARRRRQK